jgi:hypothetical protein
VRRRIHWLPAAITLVAAASCAPRLATLPSGAGTPFPEYAAAYTEAVSPCREVKTLTAVLAISGRAAGKRFRAKVDGGFEAPARVRLELPAPGKPLFTFVTTGDEATLVFPRDGRFLQKAPPAATLEALTGVPLDGGDLRAIVTGCGFPSLQPTGGRSFGSLSAVDTDGSTHWVQPVRGAWRVVAAIRGPIEVRYSEFVDGRPATIRLRTLPERDERPTDLTIRLSQVDLNTTFGPEVFRVEIPPDATPMTLDELRQAGPLGR